MDTTIGKQIQTTLIRHDPSYKQLEVKTNRTSFLCGNHNMNPKHRHIIGEHGRIIFAGIPMAQFEGILCIVDRRLQLYAMVKESSYNQRSVKSLDYETFFSGFQVHLYFVQFLMINILL